MFSSRSLRRLLTLFYCTRIQSRKITARTVKERAKKVLELTQKCAQGAPEILDGDGLEYTRESESDKALMRSLAAQSIVLLKNDNGLLPLKPKVPIYLSLLGPLLNKVLRQEQGLKKIAIVGGNAKAVVLSGGGSASLKPSYFISPYEGILNALGENDSNVEVTYSEGARGELSLNYIRYYFSLTSSQLTRLCQRWNLTCSLRTGRKDGLVTGMRTRATTV